MFLEAVLKAKPDQSLCHMYWYILVEGRRKRIDDNMLKMVRAKGGWMEVELNIDAQKGDDFRVPVEMWDRIALAYE